MEEQREHNRRLEARLTQVDNRPLQPAAIEHEEMKERPTQAQQAHTVRNSRQSFYLNNALLSPIAPPQVDPPTEQQRIRRESHGIPYTTPAPLRTTQHTVAAITEDADDVDRSKNSKYDMAEQALKKVDKFYGDAKHDKVDVYEFVDAVEFNLERYMRTQIMGTFELVIACTSGPAFTWLRNKKADLDGLVRLGRIDPEMAEWTEVVKAQFQAKMGGGQVQKLYEDRLRTLRFDRVKGSEEITKFITTFRQYSSRGFPLNEFPDTQMRSLMLGKIFEERVKKSDIRVWTEAKRTRPAPKTLEDWEETLADAWSVEHEIREEYNKLNKQKDSSTPQSVRVNQMSEDGGVVQEQTLSTDEALNALATNNNDNNNSRGGGQRRPNNKHIDGKIAKKLIDLRRCLYCYKSGHIAKDCKAPANRPPNPEELKATAGQQ